MLSATIIGTVTSQLKEDDLGRIYCSIYSQQARRSVRAIIRNEIHAQLIGRLPKGGRLSATGTLYSAGAIGPSGQTLAYLTIEVQTIKIHPGAYD